MKPRIFRMNGFWMCSDRFSVGDGDTPLKAFYDYAKASNKEFPRFYCRNFMRRIKYKLTKGIQNEAN